MSRIHRPLTTDDLVLRLVDEGRLPVSSPYACSYLPGRRSAQEGVLVESLRPETYHALMDRGFRRSGQVFYRQRCVGCSACVPLRVPCEEFTPSRSQRRVLRRNTDLVSEVAAPELTDEKYALYVRYLAGQHPSSRQSSDREGLEEFLYTTAVDTVEMTYRDAEGRLVAVSILDRSPLSLSSVYHYFDPAEHRRSLGVFSVMHEIEYARGVGIPYYYLGFWIEGSRTMHYKANYYPHELLLDGRWVRRAAPPEPSMVEG